MSLLSMSIMEVWGIVFKFADFGFLSQISMIFRQDSWKLILSKFCNMANRYSQLSLPPQSLNEVLTLSDLQELLSPLVGTTFALTGKIKTDGSRFRKVVSDLILNRGITLAQSEEFDYVPPKKKGVPRILAQLLDTYLVTSGDDYNLQIWNRIPNSDNMLVRYKNGDCIRCKDIRLVLAKINTDNNCIEAIIITTPSYIKSHYGKFGKPTVKSQLLISDILRQKIIQHPEYIESKDTLAIQQNSLAEYQLPAEPLSHFPAGKILPITILKERLIALLGQKVDAADTKTRGQKLERMVANALGYADTDNLVGGYPDVPNQLLEIKIQDAQTVDLGKYSPAFEREIEELPAFTSKDVRYFIALTNPQTNIIDGFVLTCGAELGNYFTFVASESYKCQRSISGDLFNANSGKCVVLA